MNIKQIEASLIVGHHTMVIMGSSKHSSGHVVATYRITPQSDDRDPAALLKSSFTDHVREAYAPTYVEATKLFATIVERELREEVESLTCGVVARG